MEHWVLEKPIFPNESICTIDWSGRWLMPPNDQFPMIIGSASKLRKANVVSSFICKST